MATQKVELYAETTVNDYPRAIPSPDAVQPMLFAAVGGGQQLYMLTPVGINSSTNKWGAWDEDASNGLETIRGFVFELEATRRLLDATDDKLVNVMIGGTIHRDDVSLDANIVALLDGISANTVNAALIDSALMGLRDKGFIVQGLPGFPGGA